MFSDHSIRVMQEIHKLVEASPNQAAIERSLSKERVERVENMDKAERHSARLANDSTMHTSESRHSHTGFGSSMSSSPGAISYSVRPSSLSSMIKGPMSSGASAGQSAGIPPTAGASTAFPVPPNPRYSVSQHSREPDPLSYAPSVTLSNGQPTHMPLNLETFLDNETKTLNMLADGLTKLSYKLADIGTSFRQRQISTRERITDSVARLFDEVILDVYKRPLSDD